ncbi:hypothetical protein [Methylobacterium sp. WL120]|uniref:hypothetical protein n=1 Tax=Methylobacterium sp. WL120 TaxID=2603887 RepID=UPI0011CAC7C8|nr:hypothetical protein [Methylobacterium sp. WL120]TXM63946.1 hypothetical protein FV229_20435 [Methylobacterium sp. WL120]
MRDTSVKDSGSSLETVSPRELVMRVVKALGLVLGFAAYSPAAQAASSARATRSEAAYLELAFSHDLCTRDDSELRTLNKRLSRKPANTKP